jgi:hypothetical protein
MANYFISIVESLITDNYSAINYISNMMNGHSYSALTFGAVEVHGGPVEVNEPIHLKSSGDLVLTELCLSSDSKRILRSGR